MATAPFHFIIILFPDVQAVGFSSSMNTTVHSRVFLKPKPVYRCVSLIPYLQFHLITDFYLSPFDSLLRHDSLLFGQAFAAWTNIKKKKEKKGLHSMIVIMTTVDLFSWTTRRFFCLISIQFLTYQPPPRLFFSLLSGQYCYFVSVRVAMLCSRRSEVETMFRMSGMFLMFSSGLVWRGVVATTLAL